MPLREKYESDGIQNSIIYTKSTDLITRLKNEGLILAICSNNTGGTIRRFLEKFNLKEKFNFSVGIENTFRPKPYTAGVQLILDKFGYDSKKEKVIFVGDNEHTDGAAARKLGIEYIDINVANL